MFGYIWRKRKNLMTISVVEEINGKLMAINGVKK